MANFTTEPPLPSEKKPFWKRVVRMIWIIAISYILIIACLMLLENSLLFHPTSASGQWLAPPNSQVRDVETHLNDGTPIHGWWCPMEGAKETLIYCPGNGGNLTFRSQAIADLQRSLKVSVLIFDYPGYGKSGGKPSEAGCYAAANAAYQWLTEKLQVPPDQVLIYGESLGGGVAMELALRHPPRALILMKTFTSIPDMAQKLYFWLPARWLVRNKFDNIGKIGQCIQPVFIAHGESDTLIPSSHSERLFAAANEPKRFRLMPGLDHDHLPDQKFYLELRTFLDETTPQ